MKYATILITISLCLSASPVRASGTGPCSQDRFDVKPRDGQVEVHQKMRSLIGCATDRWHVPGGTSTAVRTAECESGLWPWAHANGNYGLFQIRDWSGAAHTFLKRDWFPRWKHHGIMPRWSKGRANAIAAVRWAHASGWSAWSCSP